MGGRAELQRARLLLLCAMRARDGDALLLHRHEDEVGLGNDEGRVGRVELVGHVREAAPLGRLGERGLKPKAESGGENDDEMLRRRGGLILFRNGARRPHGHRRPGAIARNDAHGLALRRTDDTHQRVDIQSCMSTSQSTAYGQRRA